MIFRSLLKFSQDTAGHKDNTTKPNIVAVWMAPEELPDEFSFLYVVPVLWRSLQVHNLFFPLTGYSYTVVESYDRFWVMQESPGKLLGRVPPLPGNELLIKIHGEWRLHQHVNCTAEVFETLWWVRIPPRAAPFLL